MKCLSLNTLTSLALIVAAPSALAVPNTRSSPDAPSEIFRHTTVPTIPNVGNGVPLKRGDGITLMAPPPEYSGWDFWGSLLVGDIGVLVGGGIGRAIDREITGNGGSEDGSPVPFFLLATTGAATGVYGYNQARGQRGSYLATWAGSAIGTGLAFVFYQPSPPKGSGGYRLDHVWVTMVFTAALAVLPSLGGTIGYRLSRDTCPRPVPLSGALFDRGSDGVLRLSLPSVNIIKERSGTTVGVPILGGSF